MNVYTVGFERSVNVSNGEGKRREHRYVYVVALTFEHALQLVREQIPDAEVKSVNKQNDTTAHPVLIDSGTAIVKE